jgi:hypothetical protein
MSPIATDSDDIVSAASLDGIWVELPIPRSLLERRFPRLAPLRIEPDRDRRRYRICLEAWTVSNGRYVLGGIDQHESTVQWASRGAGLVGAAWGASLGWMAAVVGGNSGGVSAAIRSAASKGFDIAARAAGERARELSRSLSLGPYRELLVGVPGVALGNGGPSYMAVVGMVTDNGLARSIDGAFGYGYHKQQGTLLYGDDGSLRVDVMGKPFLSVRVYGSQRLLRGKGATSSLLNHRWAMPLLGGLHERRWVCSRLERRIEGPDTVASELAGEIEVQGDPFGAPLSGRYRLGRGTTDARAVTFGGVTARISRPVTLGR